MNEYLKCETHNFEIRRHHHHDRLFWNRQRSIGKSGCASGEMLLEKILEEDSSFMDESRRSDSLHSDRHQLISNSPGHYHHTNHHHYGGSVHVTNI